MSETTCFNVHLIVDKTLVCFWHPNALPAVGDEIRLSKRSFLKVTKRVFIRDEKDDLGQRVNLGCEWVKL